MIRRATYDDIPEMAGLLAELFTIEDDFTIDEEKQKDGLKLLVENSEAVILVAQVDSRIVGMATMQRMISTVMGKYVGIIEDVIVSETQRTLGIGGNLIESLIGEAHLRGWGRLALGADHRNKGAIGFYQKHGFTMGNMGLMYRIGE